VSRIVRIITVRSDRGESPVGTRFIVELPVVPEPAPATPHLNMHKILIVDDEAGIRESLAGILADEGYSASSTDSGEECLDVLHKDSFDVVLLDIWLPGADGLETLEKIRELDSPPK